MPSRYERHRGVSGFGTTAEDSAIYASLPQGIKDNLKFLGESYTSIWRLPAVTSATSVQEATDLQAKIIALRASMTQASLQADVAAAYVSPAALDYVKRQKQGYANGYTELARILTLIEARLQNAAAAASGAPLPPPGPSPAMLAAKARFEEAFGKATQYGDQALKASGAGQAAVAQGNYEAAKSQAAIAFGAYQEAQAAKSAVPTAANDEVLLAIARSATIALPQWMATLAQSFVEQAQVAIAPNKPLDATLAKARYARGVVQAQKNDFVTVCETTLATDIFRDAHAFTADTGVFTMLAFEGNCSNENLARIGVRQDLYQRAQIALSQLTAPGLSPSDWGLASLAPRDPARDEIAKIAADWLTTVYNWVSLALFSTNVQPSMLFPAYTTQVGGEGEYLCTRGLPGAVQQVVQNITMLTDTGKTLMQAGLYGPSWMGFYDKSPTGWLTGNFAPQHSAHGDQAMRYSTKEDRYTYPLNIRQNSHPELDAVSPQTMSKSVLKDPWFYWYYGIVGESDFSAYLTPWKAVDTSGSNSSSVALTTGPRAYFDFARAWASVITGTTLFDLVGPSFDWYANNHMQYWNARGLIDYKVSEINTFQRATAAGVAQARGAIAASAINQVGGAMMAIPNPIVQGVGAGIAIVGSLITMGVTKRRAKKRAAASKKPDPLTMRTMTDVGCATFSANLSLPEGLANCAAMLAAGDLQVLAASIADPAATGNLNTSGNSAIVSTAQAVSQTSDPTGTSSLPSTNTAPGSAQAPLQPAPETVAVAAQAQAGLPTPAALPSTLAERAQILPTPVWVGIGALAALLAFRAIKS